MIQHKSMAAGRWQQFCLVEQLANVGSEIFRTINWKNKGDNEYSKNSFYRALELLDLTIRDPKNIKRLREICRTREALVDHFVFDNEYNTTDEQWEKYFYQMTYAAALRRGR
ncbi:hypothetical protein KAU11_02090 [Candidatus Babeliales bacterium]|nr:hypothetical protein [Candidatus Babeliales bacterium]